MKTNRRDAIKYGIAAVFGIGLANGIDAKAEATRVFDIKKMIKKGHERNIMVYDADAITGELTPRLISLMKVVYIRNKKIYDRRPLRLYVGTQAIEQSQSLAINYIDIMTRNVLFGLDIIKVDGLDYEDVNREYHKYMEELEINLADDTSIVIITDESNELVLLGSY